MGQVLDFVSKNKGLAAVALLVLLSGCAGRAVSFTAPYDNGQCQRLWSALEEEIQERQVADASTARVQGFPYLRGNRYLQALAERAGDQQEQAFVLEEMRRLDLQQRALETARLPQPVLREVVGTGTAVDQVQLAATLDGCSAEFLAADQGRPDFFHQVSRGLELDRDYSLWLRGVGLYPLTSLVVDYVAQRAQAKMIDQLSGPALPAAELVQYGPEVGPAPAPVDPAALVRRGRRPPLLSLDLAGQDKDALARHFAPLLTMADGDAANRFGRLVRDAGGFTVDAQDAVVYYYFSHAFVQGIPALQITYAIWFAERTDPAPWFEHGRLDGLLFRVTLDWQGRPVFVDVAFQCGCYHFVLYADDLVRGPRDDGPGFQPYVGGIFPVPQGEKRLRFTVNGGWHQITRVEAAAPPPTGATYRLLPYEELEAFRQGDEVISLFNSQGRVPGTNRLERFFLFPMGIPKVGAMRQRGRQPITLIGRAYFDDPHLFDRAFAYWLPPPARAEVLAGPRSGPSAAAAGGQPDPAAVVGEGNQGRSE
jgi:hypothetical protein